MLEPILVIVGIYLIFKVINYLKPWYLIFGSKTMANELGWLIDDLDRGCTLAVTKNTYGYFTNGCKTILEIRGRVWDAWIWNLHIGPNTLIACRDSIGWGNHNNHYIVYLNPDDVYSWQTRDRARYGLRWLYRQILSKRHCRETRLAMARRFIYGSELLGKQVPGKVTRAVAQLQS